VPSENNRSGPTVADPLCRRAGTGHHGDLAADAASGRSVGWNVSHGAPLHVVASEGTICVDWLDNACQRKMSVH
jgi:hypothetical protein